MIDDEIFDSLVRSTGDRAGIFEYENGTGYFYLYGTEEREGRKVLAAIQILAGPPDFTQQDIAVRWDPSEKVVGLFINDQLWAVFDLQSGAKYGGNYRSGGQPEIPIEVAEAFE